MKTTTILIIATVFLFSCGVEPTIEEKPVTPEKSAEDYAREILQPPADYWPISNIEGEITNNPYKEAERHSFNLAFTKLPTDSIAYLEMRYYLFKVWNDYKYSDALEVKCFDNSQGDYASAFATGVFAPNGEWEDADPKIWIDKFELKLKFIGN